MPASRQSKRLPMKTKSAKPALVALLAAKNARHKKQPAAPASNAVLNGQNRRVLAQHYRAKYGVK
jgi:hypothetical protein